MEASHRHLPHLYVMNHPIFITFRLHGSLPPGREFPECSMNSGKAFAYMDRLLASHPGSPRYLQMPDIAQIVVDAIEKGSQSAYLLHAWVVMPNHVHVLVTPQSDVSRFLRQLKGGTAREANRVLGRTGSPFWQDESYDHLVRNDEEFCRIVSYIHQNPVSAGLVRAAEEYAYSSAGGLKPAEACPTVLVLRLSRTTRCFRPTCAGRLPGLPA